MIHEMKLQDAPFNMIKNGVKTIEMRLFDEKRQKLKKGDDIEFTNVLNNEKIVTEIINIFKYKNFEELYNNHNKIFLGYKADEVSNHKDMEKYYTKEDINKYGVVAIEIKIKRSKKDIDIANEYGTFKLRTAAVIIKNDKVLLEKSKKFNGYIFPGGHVELGEETKSSILREASEELKINFKIDNLICVHENVYVARGNKVANEIVYYYRLIPLDELPDNNFNIYENDKGVIKMHEFEWIKLSDALVKNANPKDVIKLILKNKKASNVILCSNGNNIN